MMVTENKTESRFGKIMLVKLLTVTRENCVESVLLTADNDNAAAINLYSNHGFKVLSQHQIISYYKLEIS